MDTNHLARLGQIETGAAEGGLKGLDTGADGGEGRLRGAERGELGKKGRMAGQHLLSKMALKEANGILEGLSEGGGGARAEGLGREAHRIEFRVEEGGENGIGSEGLKG